MFCDAKLEIIIVEMEAILELRVLLNWKYQVSHTWLAGWLRHDNDFKFPMTLVIQRPNRGYGKCGEFVRSWGGSYNEFTLGFPSVRAE